MTEYEFTELEVNAEIPSMDGDEAKETLSEFMESHKKNQSAYDELASELDDAEAEFKQELEEKEETIGEFKEKRAEKAAEFVNLPEELVADRFEFNEIEQIIEEGEQFSEEDAAESEDGEGGEDGGDEPITTFSQQEEKGRREGGRVGDRDTARKLLGNHGVSVRGE